MRRRRNNVDWRDEMKIRDSIPWKIKFALDSLLLQSMAPSPQGPVLPTYLCRSLHSIRDIVQWDIQPSLSGTSFDLSICSGPASRGGYVKDSGYGAGVEPHHRR